MAPWKRDLASETLSLNPGDVVWEILDLLSLDPFLAVAGMNEPEDSLIQLLFLTSSLTIGRSPMNIREKAAKTNVSLVAHLSRQFDIEGEKRGDRLNDAM